MSQRLADTTAPPPLTMSIHGIASYDRDIRGVNILSGDGDADWTLQSDAVRYDPTATSESVDATDIESETTIPLLLGDVIATTGPTTRSKRGEKFKVRNRIVDVPVYPNDNPNYVNISISDITPVGINSPPNNSTTEDNGIGGGSGGNSDEGSELPPNAVAFDDQNRNGIYDDGETTYSEDEFKSFTKKDVNLVIARDLVSNEKIDIDVNSLLVMPDTEVTTTGNSNINLDIDTGVNVSGATVDSGKDILITAGKERGSDIEATDTTFRFGGKADLRAQDGALVVNDTGDEDRTNGGTYIEDQGGDSATLTLKDGDLEGTPEFGEIDIQ